jgi:hypothetical protein
MDTLHKGENDDAIIIIQFVGIRIGTRKKYLQKIRIYYYKTETVTSVYNCCSVKKWKLT